MERVIHLRQIELSAIMSFGVDTAEIQGKSQEEWELWRMQADRALLEFLVHQTNNHVIFETYLIYRRLYT